MFICGFYDEMERLYIMITLITQNELFSASTIVVQWYHIGQDPD